jgi:hypothetical protein
MTNPVTSLDARALVSEIRQRLESPDTVRPARFKEERYDDGETTGTQRVCTTCGRVQVYGGESHNKGCVDYRRALDCQDFKEGAKRLLTAALGLIEQQQEEIRKSEEIMRESDETGLPVDSLTASGNEPVHRESTE